jgi:hypothetical protein
MKKTKRKIHIGNDLWSYWVGSGRWGEATHVTICSPYEQYYKIDASDVASSEMYVGVEGSFPTQILPSKVKEYIENKIINKF